MSLGPTRRWMWTIIAAMTLGSMLIKGHRLVSESIPIGGDEPEYIQLAHSLQAGEGFVRDDGRPTAWRTPGLPFYLASMFRLTGDDVARTRVALLLVNVLITPALMFLTWLLWRDAVAATIAGLFWMFDWNSHHLAVTLTGEEPAALLLLLALIASVIARRSQSIWLATASGLLAGSAVLMRGFLLPIVGVAPVWLMLTAGGRRRPLAAASLVAALLVVGAWMTRNAATVGTFALSTEGPEVVWIGNYQWARGSWDGWSSKQLRVMTWPQTRDLQARYPGIDRLDEVALAGLFSREATNEVRHHPHRVLWLIPRKILICFSPASYLGINMAYALALPLGVIGLIALWRRRDVAAIWVLVAPVAGVVLMALVTFADPRFRHPVDPMIYALAGYGVAVWTTSARFTATRF